MTARDATIEGKERLINIFVYGDATHVHALGWRVYEKAEISGEATAFLRARAADDHRNADRNPLPEPILRRDFEAMNRLNPFVGALSRAHVTDENAVYCVTHVVNGEVRVDEVRDEASGESVPDYLTVYRSERGLDFGQLIHDDHLEAIHLLWNNRKYVSSLKLVFSAIETFGFVEYGLGGGNGFTRWLDAYCDFGSLGVTSDELWQLRNSLIHMTNLDSRKVHIGRAHRLLPHVVRPDRDVPAFMDGMKVLHTARFVFVVLPRGIEKWLGSYNRERGKFAEFVERYDTVVSEARLVPIASPQVEGRETL